MEYFIHSVVSTLPISDVKLKELRDLNSNDPTMQMLHQYSLQGWPAHKCDVHPSLKSFWDVRNDIHVTDGILLKDNRLVMPSSWKLPWQTVASDILEHKNQNYLVVIDYYSKYIEALQLKGKASQDVIQGLNEIFSRYRYPQTLEADNTPYNS